MNYNRNNKITSIIMYAISFSFLAFIISRYFPINSDYANSPLVWREFLDKGVSSFFDWRPTPDNWYFTVYPINFAIFFLLGDDGVIPLLISTILFAALVTLFSSEISKISNGKWSYVSVIVGTTLLPQIMLTDGFVAHPFAHYSTAAYGFLMLLLFTKNLSKNNIYITTMIAAIGLIANSSDMWNAPTFFMPILLVEIYLFLSKERRVSHLCVMAAFFGLSITHVLPILMGFDIQKFEIVDISMMLQNIYGSIILIGETINISVMKGNIFYIASFFVMLFLVLISVWIGWLSGGIKRYVTITLFLSLLGIVSSYIISNNSSFPGPPRFFVNVIPCVFAILAINLSGRYSRLLLVITILFAVTSINSYETKKWWAKGVITENNQYIDFLKKHDLQYGFGDFWDKSMTVNWISRGDVKIFPIFIRDGYRLDPYSVRWQTMRSWHTEEFLNGLPKRQFFAISKGRECSDVEKCVIGIQERYGYASEVLTFKKMTILVYDDGIPF